MNDKSLLIDTQASDRSISCLRPRDVSRHAKLDRDNDCDAVTSQSGGDGNWHQEPSLLTNQGFPDAKGMAMKES